MEIELVLIRIGELSMIPNIILHVVDEKQKNDLKDGVLSRLKHVITRRIRGWYLWHARFIVC